MDKTHDSTFVSTMTDEGINRLDVLQALLRSPLGITNAEARSFPGGWVTRDEVIVTHRFILILAGVMDYTVEGRKRRLEAGAQFFVPAWCRREWTVPRKAGECRLLWCEFTSAAAAVPALLCRRGSEFKKLDRDAFERIRAQAKKRDGKDRMLRAEGELKACLARFWTEARAEGATGERTKEVHPEVARALAWLERHFTEADALEGFYRTVTLSPNHFRLLFKRQTGETVQAVLGRLRLRKARYLVQETAMPMKQIARDTGFDDPLYFSGQYKEFWGRPATEDRRTSGIA